MKNENRDVKNRFNRGYLLLEFVVALGIIGILLLPLIRYSNMLVRMKRGKRALYKNDIVEFEKVSKLSYLELLNLMDKDIEIVNGDKAQDRDKIKVQEKSYIQSKGYGNENSSIDGELDWGSIRERLEIFPVILRKAEDGWVGTGVDVAKGIGVRDKEHGYMRIVLERPGVGEKTESCQE